MFYLILSLLAVYLVLGLVLSNKLKTSGVDAKGNPMVDAVTDAICWLFDIIPVYIVASWMNNLYVNEYKFFFDLNGVYHQVVTDDGVRLHPASLIYGVLFGLVTYNMFGLTRWLYTKLATAAPAPEGQTVATAEEQAHGMG